jgi:hypothetical protein
LTPEEFKSYEISWRQEERAAVEEEERETNDIAQREKRQDAKMVEAKRDLQEKAILLREEMVKLLQRPRGEAFVRRSKTVR